MNRSECLLLVWALGFTCEVCICYLGFGKRGGRVVGFVRQHTRQTGQPRKTKTVDDRNIVRAMRKTPKRKVSDISNNLHRAGVITIHCSKETWERDSGHVSRYKAQHFWNWDEPAKLMESPKCGERMDLLMIKKNLQVIHEGGSAAAWACMDTSGTGLLIIIDDVTSLW